MTGHEPVGEEDPDRGPSASDSLAAVETLPGEVEDPRPPSLGSQRRRVARDSNVRGWLAGSLAAVFAVTVLGALLTAMTGSHQAAAQTQDLLRDLLPAELGVLGSAVGFYFGSH